MSLFILTLLLSVSVVFSVEVCECENSGGNDIKIDDCCCGVGDMNLIREEIHPLLESLVSKAFFRYYKACLERGCTYFPGDGQCMYRTCAVEECDWDEVISVFIDEEAPVKERNVDDLEFYDFLGHATPNIDPRYFWEESNDEWSIDFDASVKDYSFYDLSKNPERFTGYSGEEAIRIWRSIYQENCFSMLTEKEKSGDDEEIDMTSPDVCLEKRVFYRLVSGLHTSISVQLLNDYLLDDEKMIWGVNLEGLKHRVLDFPERIQNLQFTYLFVLRAVTKLSPYLASYNYNSKFETENKEIKELMGKLKEVAVSCPPTFDETLLFKSIKGEELKQEFKLRFRNITSILDCVTCEKCRLWGKLQISGLGTALKILFELEEDQISKDSIECTNGFLLCPSVNLQRNEIVGLINLFRKLSSSVAIVSHHLNH